MNAAAIRDPAKGRRRVLVTPEGLALPFTLGSRGARAAALILDLVLIGILETVVTLVVFLIAIGLLGIKSSQRLPPGLELIAVIWIAAMFLFRYGYFLYFELGPRGATLGKRAAGIRIAARDGGRLTAEAVIARNLLRDIEIFMPLVFLATAQSGGGLANIAAFAWLLVFVLFIFFNKDRMRAGDVIAGTWVVEAPKPKLEQAMSVGEAARGRSQTTGAEYRFGDEELSVYGEYELQALEQVLRQNQETALVAVAETICAKIGWQPGSGDERAFLEAFYAQLRAKLERDMRFGKRKADKYS
jgi:uncharacterized RDD family membrane protein YckC